MEKPDLLRINPREYDDKFLSAAEMLPWFESEKACWNYEGPPSFKKPHAQLTSNLCSNGFWDCWRILRYPNMTEILGRQEAKKLRLRLEVEDIDKVDWVVSPPQIGITFGHEVAKVLGATFGIVEIILGEANEKKMVWRRDVIPSGANVLLVDEVLTTGGTIDKICQALETGNPKKINLLPFIGALLYRPPELPADCGGRKVVALFERAIQNFSQSECPYCEVGSQRLQPKFHWQELTGQK